MSRETGQLQKGLGAHAQEQDFVSDIIACVHARYLGMRHGWPNYQLLGRVLDDWNCRLSVTFADLYKTGLFRNTNGVVKFVDFYAKYDFCEPPRVSKVGVVMNEEKEQEHKEMQELIINCLHKYFKGKDETILGLAGVGDLYVSATGGRNSKMGSFLGKGFTFKTAKKKIYAQRNC